MHIYFLSLGLSVHNSVNYWPNFFKLSTVVVDKGTSGCRGITSSLYSNWNISVIYCRIEIKLVLVKAEWWWLYFVESTFYVTSGLANMTSLSFQLRVSLLLYVGLNHKLVREIWIVHITYRSYKISCDLEGHLDFWGQLQGKWIFFLFRLISPSITPSIFDKITLIFQRRLLKKELPVA